MTGAVRPKGEAPSSRSGSVRADISKPLIDFGTYYLAGDIVGQIQRRAEGNHK